MPYIKQDRRAALDVIIDGLVKRLRERTQAGTTYWLECVVRFIACSVLIDKEPELSTPDVVCGITTDLVRRLKEIKAVKGDVNYTITRLTLESLKPDGGWGYHSLSEAVSVLRDQADWVNDRYRKDRNVYSATSVLRDVADEICRRLLGPYEDTAILKNGDMPCFDESFALKPLGIVDPITGTRLPHAFTFPRHPIMTKRAAVFTDINTPPLDHGEFRRQYMNDPIDVEFRPVAEAACDEEGDIHKDIDLGVRDTRFRPVDKQSIFKSGLTDEQYAAVEKAKDAAE